MEKYIVVRGRESEYPNPIRLYKGDVVECIKDSGEVEDWKGWVFCKTRDNEGWVPSQVIDRRDSRGIILEDYDALEFDLEEGEVLTAERALNGWIWCFREAHPHKMGWAPLNHLKTLTEDI